MSSPQNSNRTWASLLHSAKPPKPSPPSDQKPPPAAKPEEFPKTRVFRRRANVVVETRKNEKEEEQTATEPTAHDEPPTIPTVTITRRSSTASSTTIRSDIHDSLQARDPLLLQPEMASEPTSSSRNDSVPTIVEDMITIRWETATIGHMPASDFHKLVRADHRDSYFDFTPFTSQSAAEYVLNWMQSHVAETTLPQCPAEFSECIHILNACTQLRMRRSLQYRMGIRDAVCQYFDKLPLSANEFAMVLDLCGSDRILCHVAKMKTLQ